MITKKELMEQADSEYLTVKDLMKIFKVGRDKAQLLMRAIKEVNGGGKLCKGKVLIVEYENWKNYTGKIDKEVKDDDVS